MYRSGTLIIGMRHGVARETGEGRQETRQNREEGAGFLSLHEMGAGVWVFGV